MHPLEGGIVRRKRRTDRRPGMKLESPLVFYPRYWLESAAKLYRWLSLYVALQLIYRKVKRDPDRMTYSDLAVQPVADDETETRELFQSDAAHAYLEKVQRRERVRRGETV